MKSVSVECLKGLLPNLVTGWLGTVAVAGGITLGGPVAAAFSVSAICAFLACSLKGKQTSKRNADHDRKVMKSLRLYALEGRKGHAALVAQLGNLGYDLRLSKAELDQRLDTLDALESQLNASHDELIAFINKHEGLFISLSTFLEDNFDELCEALGRQDLTIDELKEGNRQILTEIGKLNVGVEQANAGIEDIRDTGTRVETGVSDLKEDMRELLRLQRRTDRERTAEIEARVRKELEAKYRQENEANPVPGAPDPKETADRVIAGLTDPQVVADSNDDPAEAGRILLRRAQAGNQQALLNAEQAARIATQAGDTTTAVEAWRFIITHRASDTNAWNALGQLHFILGDMDAANDCYRKLHQLEPEDDELYAISLGNRGLICQAQGDLVGAEELYNESLEISRKLGRLEGQANQLGNLGVVAMTRGDLDDAEKLIRESLEIDRNLCREVGQANSLSGLALIAIDHGELDNAEKLIRESLEIDRKLGRLDRQANALGTLGVIARARGEMKCAEQFHRDSLEINRKIGYLEGLASNLCNLGVIALMCGELDEAEAMHRKALELDEKLGRLEGMASDYGNLGLIYLTRGDLDQARDVWTRSRDLFKQIGMPHRVEMVRGWLDGLDTDPDV